ncbi:MFS transporter [Cellulomonas chitinilytica]|uniref:MFS transporter n=1 Tax=Cellulomonas chitinilytica TaxID=398759 RepID=A0A919TXV2_9CELL|nr:MFS transporter [Cellulomonas chitinilytica]GIG19865.1 MFS transporter [Cellulomonas chitinilytica]
MTQTAPTTWQPGSLRAAAGGLAALTLATFVALTTELVPVGLLPQMSDDLGVTESIAGLLVTVYAFMVAALAIPLTLGTRRLPRKGLLLVTLAAYTASNLLVGIAPGFGVVAAGRALGGVAHALFFSLSIGYGSRLVAPRFTGRALALVTAGASAGLVLGVPLSTTLGVAVGWRNGFLVLAAACGVATVLVATLLPGVSADDAPHADGTRTARRARLGIVSVSNTLTYLGQYVVYTYVSVILLASGLRETAVGPVLLGLGAVGLLGTAYAATSLDRHPRRGTVVVHAGMALGLLAVGLTFPTTAGVLAGAALWCGSFGAMASVFQTAAIRTRGGSPDVIGALVNSTANIGIGGGAALGALVLVGPGLEALPFVGAGLVVASLVVILVARTAFPAKP